MIADGKPRQVRYGAGSPYIDTRLPCGGAVDLLFQPAPGKAMLEQAVSLLEQRRPMSLRQDFAGKMSCSEAANRVPAGWSGGGFSSWYPPLLRIIVVGQGAECVALVQLGLAYGAEVKLLSPDEQAVALAASLGARAARLVTPAPTDELVCDPWTAIVFLFHDHDWEPQLIEQALALPSLFLGAMGSRSTHQNRIAELQARGVPEVDCARIASPLGLVPSARDPATLAVSALAQLVDRYRLAVT